MRSKLSSVLLLASFSAVGCGGAEDASTADAAPPAEAAQPAVPASTGRDVSVLQACQLLPAAEVAAIAGGKSLAEPSATGPACMYVIEVAGETESYQLLFQATDMVEALLQYQSPAEKGEKIDGPWDEAWLQPLEMAEGLALLALRRGDLAVEVHGARREPVMEMARRAVSRLPDR